MTMDEIAETERNAFCTGCLKSSNDYQIQQYKIQFEPFKAMFEVASIGLCYVCKRMAQHAVLFIQNVQSNQILLQNYHQDLSTIITDIMLQIQQPICLSQISLDNINISETESHVDKLVIQYSHNNSVNKTSSSNNEIIQYKLNKSMKVNSSKKVADGLSVELESEKIKQEMKVEDVLDQLAGDFIDGGDEYQDQYVKEEDDFPLTALLKEENIAIIEVGRLRNIVRKKAKKAAKSKILKKMAKKEVEESSSLDSGIDTYYITEEQCIEEREEQAKTDHVYLNCRYKCEDCIKGFAIRTTYEKHREKHSPSMGEYECNICKLRIESHEKLLAHKKYHTIRYRCRECGLVRVSKLTIKDHISAYHDKRQFVCPHCGKTFNRQVSMRKHIHYSHTSKERAVCNLCQKTLANKDTLRNHLRLKHPKEVNAEEKPRPFTCPECGKNFQNQSTLKIHLGTHAPTRDYYCVECDKSFKSELNLKQHLRIAMAHTNYSELPFSCDDCEKRYVNKRDLERHMNRVHLNVKPYVCDVCDRAYINDWSLREHKKYIHEGFKRPLKYPCTMCDKIFDRNAILKAHIRVHTGERPYQCSKCPAQFSQSGILGTHMKLVHLKQTRDGRPKHSVVK